MAAALIILFTLVPLVGGITLVVLAFRRSRPGPTCGACRYDLSGSVGLVTRCPECGGLFTQVGIRPPGRRSRPMLLIAGCALILLTIGCFSSMMFQRWAVQRQQMAAQAARLQAAQAQARAAAAIANAEAMRLQALIEANEGETPTREFEWRTDTPAPSESEDPEAPDDPDDPDDPDGDLTEDDG